jgi:hypothetical protein
MAKWMYNSTYSWLRYYMKVCYETPNRGGQGPTWAVEPYYDEASRSDHFTPKERTPVPSGHEATYLILTLWRRENIASADNRTPGSLVRYRVNCLPTRAVFTLNIFMSDESCCRTATWLPEASYIYFFCFHIHLPFICPLTLFHLLHLTSPIIPVKYQTCRDP